MPYYSTSPLSPIFLLLLLIPCFFFTPLHAEDNKPPLVDTFPVPSGWNCEPLSKRLQVRWLVNGSNIDIALAVNFMSTENYVSFGPSGSDTGTQMISSDVAVAYLNPKDKTPTIVDYHLSQQSPCVNGQGVCRDTESPTATNDISNVFGMMKDDSQAFFSYSRPLAAINEQTDRPISITKPTFVSWAVGALDEVDMQPLFHSNVDSYPLEDVMVSFGRTAEQNC